MLPQAKEKLLLQLLDAKTYCERILVWDTIVLEHFRKGIMTATRRQCRANKIHEENEILDIGSEVWYRCVKKIRDKGLDFPSVHPLGYAEGFVENVIKEFCRKKNKDHQPLTPDIQSQCDPEIEKQLAIQEIKATINTFPDPCKTLLIARFIEDWAYENIFTVYKKALELDDKDAISLKIRINRCKKALIKRLVELDANFKKQLKKQ